MASRSSISIPHKDLVTYNVSRLYPFLQHACEVYSGTEIIASMKGSSWKRAGEIVAGESNYHIDAGAMLLGWNEIATYRIMERFMRLTRVDLFDRASFCSFEFRQKRIWSGVLLLFEAGVPVVEYTPNLFQSRYRIVAKKGTPRPVILLSIWLAVIGLVFNA